MQLKKWIRFALSTLALLAAACFAQTPTVLSAQGSPLVFELPAAQQLASVLAPASIAQLATPAQHAERGLTYPLWLGDANFVVNTRPGQRQTIVVQAKRGNPDLATDLLLTLNNKGVRTLVPSTLIFDKLNTFAAAAPLPAAYQATSSAADQTVTSSAPQAKLIDFAPPVATSYPISSPSIENHATANVSARVSAKSHSLQGKASQKKPVAISPPAAILALTPIETASQATPSKALQASAAVTAVTTPPVRPPAMPISPSQMPAPQADDGLSDWLLLAGGIILVLLLIYLAAKKLKNRGKPSQSKPASLAPEQSANTVFGLSNEEAGAMHEKWLSEKILQKN